MCEMKSFVHGGVSNIKQKQSMKHIFTSYLL